MKKLYIRYLICVFCVPLMAQTTITTSGGNASGSGGTAAYSVGQIINTNINGSNGSVNHGVQQPVEFFTLEVDNLLTNNFKIKVYPNPTSNDLQLSIENLNSNNLKYYLYNVLGHTLNHQKINNPKAHIITNTLPSGIYFLKITKNNLTIKTVKIVKN